MSYQDQATQTSNSILPNTENAPKAVQVAEKVINKHCDDSDGLIDFTVSGRDAKMPIKIYFDGMELRIMFWYEIDMPPFKMPDPMAVYTLNDGEWVHTRLQQQHLKDSYDSDGLGKNAKEIADDMADSIEETYC